MKQPAIKPPLSRFRCHDELIFVSGQVPVSGPERHVPDSFEDQVAVTLSNLNAVVAAAGAEPGSILKVGVFLTDRQNIPVFNQLYSAFFNGHDLPARTMLISGLPDPRYLVEIECIAVRTGR